MLKSLFIEKYYEQLESKETLIKKLKQWKRIWTISFDVSEESFPVINFTREKKTHKKVEMIQLVKLLRMHVFLLQKKKKTRYIFNSFHIYKYIVKKGEEKIFKIWGCMQ